MTRIIDSRPTRCLSPRLAVGLALAAVFSTSSIVGTASAQPHWNGNHNTNQNWNGGYYHAPPVVYGSPYDHSYYGTPYNRPPIVCGPGVGINIQVQ
jgi:hypothetical protein